MAETQGLGASADPSSKSNTISRWCRLIMTVKCIVEFPPCSISHTNTSLLPAHIVSGVGLRTPRARTHARALFPDRTSFSFLLLVDVFIYMDPIHGGDLSIVCPHTERHDNHRPIPIVWARETS